MRYYCSIGDTVTASEDRQSLVSQVKRLHPKAIECKATGDHPIVKHMHLVVFVVEHVHADDNVVAYIWQDAI